MGENSWLKQCSQCGKWKPKISGFHLTSRVYQSASIEMFYSYQHKKCKDCRNLNRRLQRVNHKK